ncbi:ABC transporter permease [Nonomuraea sp. K274]|uniref:ABC transporter permease n=1 Tax=Nonomuraea cypriaca TaxID=1187855 RepID=A0A931AC90_9ACTN|nr:FtsX-like permease family protein [Nonomuraea cypriaca]MBF8187484.1 ABC transporter permease [Nonomuraea cypriaca]
MNGLMAVKLRRDLRISWSRFVLMVIAIAVSLTVFGGLLAAWTSIGRETSGAYMSTEPASATIVLDRGLDPASMAALAAEARKRPGVSEATGRTQFDAAVAVNGQQRAVPLQVFVAAPDDPMRMAQFDLRQEGTWPPPPGEILIGGDSLGLLGVAPGDGLTVTPPGAPPLRLRVSGTVYDPSLAPSPQEQRGHAYLSAASLQPAVLDQLKIQVAEPGQRIPSRDRDTVVKVAGEVGAWLQRDKGLAIAEIQVPAPYAHPHQWQADVLLLSLMAGGAAALLLSTILVANMLNNLFTQQIPQIGIMKAVGANSGRIARLYLAMVLLVSAAATLLALVPATLIGRYLLGRLLGTLGIQATNVAAPWWAYAVIVAVGLGLPPLMALRPLVRASRITVRAAIDHHGGSSKPSGAIARLSRLHGLDRGLLMALRNTVRRPARFWLSVGMLASAGAVFVASMSLNSGTQAVEEQRRQQRYWDVDAQLDAPARAAAVAEAVRTVPGVERVEAWKRAKIGIAGPDALPFTRTYPDQGHGSVSVNTVPEGPLPAPPTMLQGRWLQPGETGAVVLSQIVRDNTVPGLGAGDTVRLFIDGKPSTWRIAGIVEEREGGGGDAYTTAAGLAAASGQPPLVNQVRVMTTAHDEQTRQSVAAAVERALTGAGMDVGVAASVSRTNAASAGHMGPVLLVLLGVALPLGVVGAIGLASTMSANILDRTREFGVMHAIGARPKTVRRIVVAEGVLLALAGCVVAILPALGLTAVLGVGLGNLFTKAPLPFRVSLPAVGIWVVLSVLGAMLATEAAASRASRITVREALTYL